MCPELINIECRSCHGVLVIQLGTWPLYGRDEESLTFEVKCPLCSSEFPVGVVKKVREIKDLEPRLPQQGQLPSLPQSGGSFAGGLNQGASPNDQRSNALNPNNPAYKAGGENRSNQLNPNNPAYHSSRGHTRK